MRILHSTTSLNPAIGGPARSVPQLASAQAGLGHEVVVWCADRFEQSGADMSGTECKFSAEALDQVLSKGAGFDLVHDHGLWQPFHHQVAVRCQGTGTPRVVSPRGMLEPWALGHKRLKKKLAWWLYQNRDLQTAAALHATARAEAEQFRRLGFLMPVFAHPNGVQIPETFRHEKRLESNSNHRLKTVLFLSRIHPVKGLHLWVDAWNGIKPKGWKMHVVGPDETGHRREIERKVQRAGLSDCWSFSSAVEGVNKWRLMRQADLFVLPTYSESFGIVVAEALGVGVPVITTTSAPWEGLQSNDCGWWVTPEVTALAGALRQATELSSNELRNMGKRGQCWVRDTFAWPVVANAIIRNYEKVIRNHV